MGKRKYENENDTEDSSKKPKSSITVEIDVEDGDQPQKDENHADRRETHHGFDVKHLRKELASKQGQTTVLTQFLQVCLNPDNEEDYLLEYLKCGGNSHEILRQITQDSKKNLTLTTPAFHLFHLIIVKVQSSLPHMITITEEACRFFLNTFMSTVEIMISESSGPRHRKIILKLLTSMVTLNSDLGIEILNQAPLTPKHLQHIVEKCNYKEKDNVRTCFVHFMTSFLLERHLPLIKALLEKPGLLGLVIPGLINDEAEAVMMFLNILKKNVVDNALISKSTKLKTFSQYMLHNMFKIFSWKGPPETSYANRNESRQEIVSLLSDILVTLFTNHKIGLHFTDNSLGMSDANKNPVLFKALLSLKRPWESESESDTILEIIHKCPDLHRAIVSVIEQSFEPKHSPIWERTVEFTIKLLNKLRPEEMILRMTNLPPTQTANFVRFVTLPVPLLKFIQNNLGKDQTISLYCVKVLVKMLHTLRRYMQIMETNDSSASISDLKNRLEYFLPKHMPAPAAVSALIDKVIACEKVPETVEDYSLPKINDTDALISLVDLLLLYNDIHPTFFDTLEGTIDMKKILDYSVTLSDTHVSLLKFKVVSLWLVLDSSAISLKNSMFKELFLIMLDVYTSDDESTCVEAKDTLRSFFKNTAIFESDEDEIHLILYTLRNSKVNPPSLIGDVVEYILENIEELSEHVRSNIVNDEIADENSKVSLDRLFDDLSDNRSSENSTFLENKVPSPFVVGCIKYLQQNKNVKKNLKQFLSLYIVNLLHNNYSPELTEGLMNGCKLEPKSYVTGWVSQASVLPDCIVGQDKTLLNISRSITDNEDLALVDTFDFLEEASAEDKDIILSETAYKINFGSRIDSSELLIWAKYLIFCTVRLADLGQLTFKQQQNIRDYFQCIIAIGRKHLMIDECRMIILNLLKNPHVLKIYEPLDFNQNECRLLATQFIIEVINDHKDVVNYLNTKYRVLKSFQQKNYNEIVKAIEKIKNRENANCEHMMNVLETIGLANEDDARVLSLIFSTEPGHCVGDDKEPTMALELLRHLIDKYSNSVSLELQPQILRKSMILYTNLLTSKDIAANLTKLETSLANYLENKPHQANKVSEELFKKFFEATTLRKTTSHLAYVLLRNNVKFCNSFKEQIVKPDILSQRELALPLGSAILSHKTFLLENQQVLVDYYNEYKSNINKMLEKPHKAGQVYIANSKFIRKLILECMDTEECGKLFSKSHKFEAVEISHVHLVQATFLKLCTFEKVTKDHLINYFGAMLHLIMIALKEGKETKIVEELVISVYRVVQITKIVQALSGIQKEEFKKFTETALWQNFCRAVLKDSLKAKAADRGETAGPRLLCLLTNLVKLFYPAEHEDVASLFDMVTSHSEFLNVMLSHSGAEIKTRLVEFLYAAATANGAVMKSRQLPVFLSAYRATRSPCDRTILAILRHYEARGLPLDEYKPYVWGAAGAAHYAVRRGRAAALWAHPEPNQVLGLLERDVVERTVRNYPVERALDYHYEPPGIDSPGGAAGGARDAEGAVARLAARGRLGAGQARADDAGAEYDPAFVVPLLSHLLAPGSAAACARVWRGGALALAAAALAARCPRMRAAAASVLHRFCTLLDTQTRHKNDKLFLSEYMSTLRHSLRAEPGAGLECPRAPAAGALYLASALLVSSAPYHPLYKPVTNFLIAKRSIDLTVVPDFLSLFHDADVEAADRRLWILDVVRHGTKTASDLDVVFKTMCVKMVMDYYSSVLCDRKTREKILDVIAALVAIPRAVDIFVEGYGLLSWLHCVGRRIQRDKLLAKGVLAVVENVIRSMKHNSLARSSSNNTAKADIPELKINKDVENEIVLILYDSYRSVEGLEEDDLLHYLKVYNSISKRTIKNMSKNQVASVVNMVGALRNIELILLLNKALAANDCNMMRSKIVESSKGDPFLQEVISFVLNYLV